MAKIRALLGTAVTSAVLLSTAGMIPANAATQPFPNDDYKPFTGTVNSDGDLLIGNYSTPTQGGAIGYLPLPSATSPSDGLYQQLLDDTGSDAYSVAKIGAEGRAQAASLLAYLGQTAEPAKSAAVQVALWKIAGVDEALIDELLAQGDQDPDWVKSLAQIYLDESAKRVSYGNGSLPEGEQRFTFDKATSTATLNYTFSGQANKPEAERSNLPTKVRIKLTGNAQWGGGLDPYNRGEVIVDVSEAGKKLPIVVKSDGPISYSATTFDPIAGVKLLAQKALNPDQTDLLIADQNLSSGYVSAGSGTYTIDQMGTVIAPSITAGQKPGDIAATYDLKGVNGVNLVNLSLYGPFKTAEEAKAANVHATDCDTALKCITRTSVAVPGAGTYSTPATLNDEGFYVRGYSLTSRFGGALIQKTQAVFEVKNDVVVAPVDVVSYQKTSWSDVVYKVTTSGDTTKSVEELSKKDYKALGSPATTVVPAINGSTYYKETKTSPIMVQTPDGKKHVMTAAEYKAAGSPEVTVKHDNPAGNKLTAFINALFNL